MENINEMTFTEEQIEAAQNCETADDVLALAQEVGIEITRQQAEAFIQETQNCELDDDALEDVNGGTMLGISSLMNVFGGAVGFFKTLFGIKFNGGTQGNTNTRGPIKSVGDNQKMVLKHTIGGKNSTWSGGNTFM